MTTNNPGKRATPALIGVATGLASATLFVWVYPPHFLGEALSVLVAAIALPILWGAQLITYAPLRKRSRWLAGAQTALTAPLAFTIVLLAPHAFPSDTHQTVSSSPSGEFRAVHWHTTERLGVLSPSGSPKYSTLDTHGIWVFEGLQVVNDDPNTGCLFDHAAEWGWTSQNVFWFRCSDDGTYLEWRPS